MNEMEKESIKLYLDETSEHDEKDAFPHFYDMRRLLQTVTAMNADDVEILIAPGVYWIDNSDAADTVKPEGEETVPYGEIVRFRNLTLRGMGADAGEVVIAGNRGNAHGACGNYTMFHFIGESLTVENLTFGNYCNVDLEYPLNPGKNHKKRTEVITQAQIGHMEGSALHAKNCGFVSRLNLVPICGADNSSYQNCYFECGDDSLNGNARYIECEFKLYSDKPIYAAHDKGAIFSDCRFHCISNKGSGRTKQYLTKQGGYVSLSNCEFIANGSIGIEWTPYPSCYTKCHQTGVMLNGTPIQIGLPNKTTQKMIETKEVNAELAMKFCTFEESGFAFDFTCEPENGAEGIVLDNCTLVMGYCRPHDTLDYDKWEGAEAENVWRHTQYEATDARGEAGGIIPTVQGAGFFFADKRLASHDLKLELQLNPAKTEGQGFGSAGQYLDIGIQMDARTISGYALRIKRVSAAADAVAFMLVQYREGRTMVISEEKLSSCFITNCLVTLEIKEDLMTANVKTTGVQPEYKRGKYLHNISLESKIERNEHSGVMILSTSTIGTGGWQNTTMVQKIRVSSYE